MIQRSSRVSMFKKSSLFWQVNISDEKNIVSRGKSTKTI